MSDDMNMNDQEQFAPMGEVTPLPAEPIIKPEAISRNALLIVAGVILLAVTVGLVVWAMSLVNNTPPAPTTTLPPITKPGTGSTTPTAPITPIPSVEDRDIFTPRNPFEVIEPIQIAVPKSSADSTDTADNNNDNNNDNEGTLQLTDIVTVDSVLKAVVKLDGQTYTLAAGEQVGSSAWSIVEVNSDNIVALYGDDQVTISLGS